MRLLFTFIVSGVALLGAASPAFASYLNVFACTPEWAALAHEIGGDSVKITTATTAKQDPHYIRARPSLIAAMRRADIVICSGASLEIGWLPLLLQKSGNRAVQPGQPSYILASDHVPLLGIPSQVSRKDGDVHPEGNPHMHLNPETFVIMADVLAARFAAQDGEHADTYHMRKKDFLTRWHVAMARWQTRAQPLRGKGYIAHHKNWLYLADWLNLKTIAHLEPKPGVPPTSKHLAQLRTQTAGADFIFHAPHTSDKAAKWLGEQTGLPVILLPFTVGGTDSVHDLFSLFDVTLSLLLKDVR